MIAVSPKRRVLLWVLLGALTVTLVALAMRGYLSAEMLLSFSSLFNC